MLQYNYFDKVQNSMMSFSCKNVFILLFLTLHTEPWAGFLQDRDKWIFSLYS